MKRRTVGHRDIVKKQQIDCVCWLFLLTYTHVKNVATLQVAKRVAVGTKKELLALSEKV